MFFRQTFAVLLGSLLGTIIGYAVVIAVGLWFFAELTPISTLANP